MAASMWTAGAEGSWADDPSVRAPERLDTFRPSAILESKLINQFTHTMATSTIAKNKRTQNVVSALTARTQFGQILKRAAEQDERFVVDRRGKPSVIIMSVRDYIRNIAPTPTAYQAIRQEAKKNGSSSLSMREVNREIAAYRRQSRKSSTQPAA